MQVDSTEGEDSYVKMNEGFSKDENKDNLGKHGDEHSFQDN